MLEEFGKFKFGHPVCRAAHVDWVHEVALHPGDMCYGKVGKGAVLKIRILHSDLLKLKLARYGDFGHDIAVGENNTC